MSANPAAILGVPGGSVAVGQPADLVLFDTDTAWTVEPDKLVSKSKNTPYAGKRLTGRVMATVCRGKIVYELRE